MKKVFTLKEDICARNGKTDAQIAGLVAKLSEYGIVEDYDNVVLSERTDYQKTIDGLKAYILSIEEKNVTDSELVVVRALRNFVATEKKSLETENNTLKADIIKREQEANQFAQNLAQMVSSFAKQG